VASRNVYIFPQGNYFEGNVARVVVLFCISQKQGDSGNILKLPRSAVPLHEIKSLQNEQFNIFNLPYFTALLVGALTGR
jgi:hypothetical protein